MPQPSKIPLAFAASGDKNTIPESTETTGLASWRNGFPAITSTPFSEGGVAPKRADFNGIFNALSLAIIWQQQGGFYAYSNAVDYEIGNVVIYNNDLYKCVTANGPSTSVRPPTDTTVWSRVMTAADAAALYLPLSGGTMTGSIKTSATLALGRTNNSSQLTLVGGSDTNASSGAKCVLNGANYTNSGWFDLQAGNSGGYKQLIGKPDGTLTWDGHGIPTLETGTFTPYVFGGTTAGEFTYSGLSASYVKIAQLVFVEFAFSVTVTTAPSGYVNIGGLPYGASSASQSILLNIGVATNVLNYPPFMFRVGSNGNMNLYGINQNTNSLNPCAFSNVSEGASMVFRSSGIYKTNS